MSLRDRFIRFDDALAEKGVPPLKQWWRDGIGAWLDAYEAGGALELYAACGRGAAKSTALYKLALFFTLFGDVNVPVGERHFAIVLSRLVSEASKGIAIISRWMQLLGIGHKVAGEVIELDDLPRGIRVAAASVAATSGWRAYAVFKDERSKWPASGIDDVDAEEIDTSASAMTATHARAPEVSFGSAWAARGAFHAAIMAGTDETHVVLGPTPTWVAAPHVTEASCRRKERDPRKFQREYACVFQAGACGVFDETVVDAAIRPLIGCYEAIGEAYTPLDSSMGRGDAWSWCFAQWCYPLVADPTEAYVWDPLIVDGKTTEATGIVMRNGIAMYPRRDATGALVLNPAFNTRPVLVIHSMRSLEGKFAQRIAAHEAVAEVSRDMRRAGARTAMGDGYQAYFLAGEFAKSRQVYLDLKWTNTTKSQAVADLVRMLRDGELIIEAGPEAEKLRTELLDFRETIAASGALTYGARRGGHDDRVALLINAVMAEREGLLRGSPNRRGSAKATIYGSQQENREAYGESWVDDAA